MKNHYSQSQQEAIAKAVLRAAARPGISGAAALTSAGRAEKIIARATIERDVLAIIARDCAADAREAKKSLRARPVTRRKSDLTRLKQNIVAYLKAYGVGTLEDILANCLEGVGPNASIHSVSAAVWALESERAVYGRWVSRSPKVFALSGHSIPDDCIPGVREMQERDRAIMEAYKSCSSHAAIARRLAGQGYKVTSQLVRQVIGRRVKRQQSIVILGGDAKLS